MNQKISPFSRVILVAVAMSFPIAASAQLHAERMTRPDPIGPVDFSTSAMLALSYTPSPEAEAYEDGVGGELSVLLNEGSAAGLKLSIGVERWEASDGGSGDLSLIPLGIGFQLGTSFSDGFLGYVEAGIKYSFVDVDGGSFDDAVSGFIGAGVLLEAFGTGGVDLSVGYQFDIQESDNDAGDELSLEGLFLRIGLRTFP